MTNDEFPTRPRCPTFNGSLSRLVIRWSLGIGHWGLGPRRHLLLLPIVAVLLPSLSSLGAEPVAGPRLLDQVYEGYAPVFDRAAPRELMKASIQPTFYNRALVVTDQRADALVREGIKQEP